MIGSEKQIKWAEDIRSKVAAALPDMSSNPIADKAKQFLLSIDDAKFWIEVAKDRTPMFLLQDMVQGGLRVKGLGFDHIAKLDQTTGMITITWTDVVADGKGGHVETHTKTI